MEINEREEEKERLDKQVRSLEYELDKVKRII